MPVMSNPRLLKVSEVNGWVMLRRTWPDSPERDGDWLLTHAEGIEGPVLAFRTVDAATRYAQGNSVSLPR